MTLMGVTPVTLEAVRRLPVPQRTRSYTPVPYVQASEFVRHALKDRLGLADGDIESRYGLARNGHQFFALHRIVGDNDMSHTYALRTSDDKSLALGVVAGRLVTCCSNGIFTGDMLYLMRKHTLNVWQDFTRLVYNATLDAADGQARLSAELGELKNTPCGVDRGFSLLGVMYGRGLLTPRQASVAFGDWREPRHEEFAERNLWSLYNCATEGLKKGGLDTVVQRHTGAHGFFQEALRLAKPVAGTVINAS